MNSTRPNFIKSDHDEEARHNYCARCDLLRISLNWEILDRFFTFIGVSLI